MSTYGERLAPGMWRLMMDLAGWQCQNIYEDGTRCHMTTDLQVHHLTYDRYGCERIEDLVVLCGTHHMMIHGLVKQPPNTNSNSD
jgi:hypothetical protein